MHVAPAYGRLLLCCQGADIVGVCLAMEQGTPVGLTGQQAWLVMGGGRGGFKGLGCCENPILYPYPNGCMMTRAFQDVLVPWVRGSPRT